MIKIRRGLDLPISGKPKQSIEGGQNVQTVALVGYDYHGMKPTMAVKEGDTVKLGQVLFSDKKTEGVVFTSPAAGTVKAINRGDRRVFQSIEIEVQGDDAVEFDQYSADQLGQLSRDQVVDNLVKSGMWTALRTRPYSKVPAIGSAPANIFVSAMDTNPLAADAALVIAEESDAFALGLDILAKLTEGKLYVSHAASTNLPQAKSSNVEYRTFGGVHPAGNVGTQMHLLAPVSLKRVAWSIGYQDVIAVAKLFLTGKLSVERVVSLAGPKVTNPRLVRTRVGASLTQLTASELAQGENRVVSGSVFGGRKAEGALAYLGRYHLQISVLEEGNERPFLHYFTLGGSRFSKLPIYISKLFGGKTFDFTTSANGSERAMVPIGAYENVMPLDILATQLLRAIAVGDTEVAQKLGCLELDEEDLALCTFVSVGKYEYGPILRDNLTRIEKEG